MHLCEVSNTSRGGLIICSLIFAFAFPPLDNYFAVVARGQNGHTPAKLPEVDLLVLVFIQGFHGLINVVCIYLALKNTQSELIQHEKAEQGTLPGDAECDRLYL